MPQIINIQGADSPLAQALSGLLRGLADRRAAQIEKEKRDRQAMLDKQTAELLARRFAAEDEAARIAEEGRRNTAIAAGARPVEQIPLAGEPLPGEMGPPTALESQGAVGRPSFTGRNGEVLLGPTITEAAQAAAERDRAQKLSEGYVEVTPEILDQLPAAIRPLFKTGALVKPDTALLKALVPEPTKPLTTKEAVINGKRGFYTEQEIADAKAAGGTVTGYDKPTSAAGDNLLTANAAFQGEVRIGNNLDKNVKEYYDSRRSVAAIESGLGEARSQLKAGKTINFASQAVLVGFQKLLDPTSVVRESEYARSGDGQSAVNRWKGAWLKLSQGGAGVTLDELEGAVQAAERFYAASEKEARSFAKRSEKQLRDLHKRETGKEPTDEELDERLQRVMDPQLYELYKTPEAAATPAEPGAISPKVQERLDRWK